MEIAKIVLEYCKVFLSTQVIIGSLVISFLYIFKEDIRSLIKRIAFFNFPGGGKMAFQEQPTEELSKPEPSKIVEIEKITPTTDTLKLSKEQENIIKEILNAEKNRATLWEYRYLNYFLRCRAR